MTDFLTHAWLLEKFGPRLGLEQLAEVMRMTRGGISNAISAGHFPIPTYTDAGRRFADAADVARHLARCRLAAKVSA